MSEEIKNEEAIENQQEEVDGTEPEPENANDGEKLPPEETEVEEESAEEVGERTFLESKEPTKKEKRRANELEVIEEATVETELEMLVKMWNEYNDHLKKDKVLELYMQGIFILNRGAQQIGLELGGLQQKIKGQIQFLNYLAGKIKLLKDQYEQNTK